VQCAQQRIVASVRELACRARSPPGRFGAPTWRRNLVPRAQLRATAQVGQGLLATHRIPHDRRRQRRHSDPASLTLEPATPARTRAELLPKLSFTMIVVALAWPLLGALK
jgi:hypothetical protein